MPALFLVWMRPAFGFGFAYRLHTSLCLSMSSAAAASTARSDVRFGKDIQSAWRPNAQLVRGQLVFQPG
jgi:hypothetical protein